MSTAPEAVPGGGTPAAPPSGLAGSFFELYLAPKEAFGKVLAHPWWIALLGFMVLQVLFTAVWMQKVDPQEFMREQMAASPQAARMPAEQVEQVVQQQARFFPVFAWLGALVFGPLALVVTGLVYLLVFRFLMGGDVGFRGAMGVVAWSFLAVSLVTTPLILITMAAQGQWSVDPRVVIQANPALFLDKASTSPMLYSLLDSLDLFSFWALFLLAVGFGVANRRPTGWAAPGVLGAWVLYVLARAGLSALF